MDMPNYNRSRHYRIKASSAGRENLSKVMSVQEAAALFMVSESTIRYAIDAGKIAARQSAKGRAWFISTASLVEIYGHSPLIMSQKLRNKKAE